MTRIALATLLLAVSTAASAQAYRCLDERGKTIYSDKAGPGCKRVKGDANTSAATKSSAPSSPADRDRGARIAREQARCASATQSYRRGDDSDPVRDTLRNCY